MGRDLSVYTGTSGILQFPDTNNNNQDIFLYNSEYVPAPLYYWKVLHDADTNTAAAFIGLNNPHESVAPLEVCTNTCAQMSWVDWEMTDLPGGFMYCCSLEEAATAFKEISSLGLTSSGLIQAPGGGEETTPAPSSTPAAGNQCLVDLDNLSGKYPPLLTSNNNFVYPTSEEADGTRYLKISKNIIHFIITLIDNV